jgi:endogenous inhibitor of DNA gyrase (YacG/DUF329 family)
MKEFTVTVKCSQCGHDIELIVHSETAFKFLKGYDRAVCSICNENSKWNRVING